MKLALQYKLAGKPPKCALCRSRMEKQDRPLLFLLPLYHDDEYIPSAAYYNRHCTPIEDVSQIPTGRRACRLWVCVCPSCGRRKIAVEDFLRVRDVELSEKYTIYEEAELSSLL